MDQAPSSIIGKVRSLLPLLLLCMVGLGLVMFAIVNILPHWKTYQGLQAQVDAGNKAIEAQAAQSDTDAEIAILKHRIETSHLELTTNTSIFMSSTQADDILQKLYTYAKQSTVEIENLQTQNNLDSNTQTADPTARLKQPSGTNGGQAAAPLGDSPAAYAVRALRITANGNVLDLIRFLTRIRETAVPGIAINNLIIKNGDSGSSLMMDVLIYTSPLSDGKAYENLTDVLLPTPMVVVEPTIVVPTPAPASAVQPTAESTANSTSVTIVDKNTIPPEPVLNPVYNDNFDGGNLNHWKLGAGWILFGNAGAKALQVTDNSGDATFAYDTLMNSAVEMRVLMSSSNIKLTLRQSSAGSYGVVLQPTGQIALYRGNDLVKSTTNSTSSIGRWRVLRLSVVQGIIRISVDGVEVLTALDSNELPPGTFAFSTVGRGVVQVDDVQVWSLDTKTPF